MKISMATAELGKALYRVQGLADRKSAQPILANVLIDATTGQQVVVSATDMDVGLTGTYAAEVLEPGVVAVPSRQLYDIVRTVASPSVTLEKQENNWIDVRAGAGHFRLVGADASQYPSMPSSAPVPFFSVDKKQLAELIDRTVFCVSTDDNRHNLSGVYCESPKPHVLRMVATDGHRMAMAEHEFEVDIPIEKGVIVPRKGFLELKRVLGDGASMAGNVELGFSGSSGVLKADNVVLSTRLVEGQFPDYNQVIPKSAARTAIISRHAFIEALRRVSVLSDNREYGVHMTFNTTSIDLLAEDPKFGDARESIEIESQGEPVTIGFNARYIVDVLTLIHEDRVCFLFSDHHSPGVIQAVSDKSFLAVVMPMRI